MHIDNPLDFKGTACMSKDCSHEVRVVESVPYSVTHYPCRDDQLKPPAIIFVTFSFKNVDMERRKDYNSLNVSHSMLIHGRIIQLCGQLLLELYTVEVLCICMFMELPD